MKGKLLFLAAAMIWSCPASGQNPPDGKAVIAQVGGGAVLQQDIMDWQAAQACYGEGAITSRKAGFMRMFEATILEETLRREAAREISAGEYKKEVERIDSETRAPDILACIKKYFAGDTNRYQRVFIRPILAQSFIREFVKHDPKVQAKAYSLRDAILREMGKEAAFKSIADARKVEYSTAEYSLEADTAAPKVSPYSRGWSPFEAEFIEKNLRDLTVGQVNRKPIEDEADIKFVKLTGVNGKKYSFESLTIKKITTDEYLSRIAKLACRINDRELYDWAAPIKGNPILAPANIAPYSAAQ